MPNPNEFTLVCPENDLEGVTIIEIAKQYGIDTRGSKQDWGGKLGKEPGENLQDLKRKVVVVELFDLEAEEQLRRDGHEVIIIDHHKYAGASRWSPKSSLEQFCNLIGHAMTSDLWKIAANDVAFIDGLFRLGLSYEDMERVRIDERKILGTTDIFNEALILAGSNQNLKRFNDLDVLLVPIRFQRVMGEAAQWLTKKDYESAKRKGRLEIPNCLLIYHDEVKNDQILQIEFYGDAQYSDAFDELVNDNELSYFFEMWRGGSTSACYWGAKPRGEIAAEINKLIDRVLSFTLIQGRPLRHFSTTFLFPFRFKSEKPPSFEVAECSPESYEAEELIYFLPHIKELLYNNSDEKKTGVKRWLLPLGEASRHLDVSSTNINKITLPLTHISLYQFFNDIHILEVSILKTTDPALWNSNPFWRLLFSSEISEVLTVEDALIVNNLSRILYSSYAQQEIEEKLPESILWHRPGKEKPTSFRPKFRKSITSQDSFSPVIKEMIAAFVGSNVQAEIDLDAVSDDRMFVHSCFALSGDKPVGKLAEERYHALFATAVYVDRIDGGYKSQSDYCYDATFTKELIKPLTYTRWYGPFGNLYGFSRFSAVFMGFGSSFHKFVTKHISTMYLRQSIMALFYRSSLLHYNHLMIKLQYPPSDKEESEVAICLENIRKTHWELTLFSNKYWYSELTSQDQGIELFELQSKAMDIKNEYDRVKQKIESGYEVLDTTLQTKLSKTLWWAGILGFLFVIISITASFSGISIMMPSVMSTGFNTVLFWIDAALTISGVIAFLIFAPYLVSRIIKLHGKVKRLD